MAFRYLCQKLPSGDSPSFRSNSRPPKLASKCFQPNAWWHAMALKKIGPRKSFQNSTKIYSGHSRRTQWSIFQSKNAIGMPSKAVGPSFRAFQFWQNPRFYACAMRLELKLFFEAFKIIKDPVAMSSDDQVWSVESKNGVEMSNRTIIGQVSPQWRNPKKWQFLGHSNFQNCPKLPNLPKLTRSLVKLPKVATSSWVSVSKKSCVLMISLDIGSSMFCFAPVCFFKCLFKLPATEDA